MLVAAGAGVFASDQLKQVTEAKIETDTIQGSAVSKESFISGQTFEALLEALKAGKTLKQLDASADTTKNIKK